MIINKAKFITLLLLLTITYSCKNSCANILDFKITDNLILEAHEQKINYCKLLKQALKADKKAIKEICDLKLKEGEVVYEHGAVLLEVISAVGEDVFFDSIKSVSKENKNQIYWTILAGFDFTENKRFKGRRLEETLPLIYSLKNR